MIFGITSGKRHFVRDFHYDLPDDMFVTICRHIKKYMVFGMTKILNKQGVRNESCPVDRNGQQYC